jgi:translation initiation factor 2B subunit (eIF-2B alpha/beta/delta family)
MADRRDRLPAAVVEAAGDREGGATEVARRALDGLVEVAADPDLLAEAIELLVAGQPAMAPMWHLARAAASDDPATALADLRWRLDRDQTAATGAAAHWLQRRPGPVATVSHSSLVDAVLARLRSQYGQYGEAREGAGGEPAVALVGADAIGPEALLNATGTRALAERLPTLVVSIPIKLVPAAAFERLAAPGFETVPLDRVAAVALGPEVLEGAEVGRRAAALGV